MGTTNKVAQGLIDMAKRIESLDTALAAMTAERDAQAEAVRVLGAEVKSWWIAMEVDPLDGGNKETLDVYHNPIARAAVEGDR